MSKADLLWLGMSRLEVELKRGIMFFWEGLKKKKVLICEWSVGSLFSVWRVPGFSLDKACLLWMNFLKGSTIKASLLGVCVCMWLRAQAHVCRERTPLIELREWVRETEKQRNACWELQLVFQSCFCCLWLCCVCIRACVCVCCMCDRSNWSKGWESSLLYLPVLIKMKEAQMWMRDWLI